MHWTRCVPATCFRYHSSQALLSCPSWLGLNEGNLYYAVFDYCVVPLQYRLQMTAKQKLQTCLCCHVARQNQHAHSFPRAPCNLVLQS